MTLDEFWKIIDETRQGSEKLADMPARLVNVLGQMEEREIADFESHRINALFRAYDANLWLGAVVTMNGCGDDKFTDFRCWLIAQGRDVYEAALANPDSLANVKDFTGDYENIPVLFKLGSAAKKAFCLKVAGNEYNSAAENRFETLCPFKKRPPLKNQELINKGEEQAALMFPALAARFPKTKHKSCFDE